MCRLRIPRPPLSSETGSLPPPVPAVSLALTGGRHHHVDGGPISDRVGGVGRLTFLNARPGNVLRRPGGRMGTMLASPPGGTGSNPVAFLVLEWLESPGDTHLKAGVDLSRRPGAAAWGVPFRVGFLQGIKLASFTKDYCSRSFPKHSQNYGQFRRLIT